MKVRLLSIDINKLKCMLVAYFYVVKHHINNFISTKSGLNLVQREHPIVVTLTSFPPRFKSVYLTIESLLNQDLKPDKIILWLAKEEAEKHPLPYNLLKLKARGLEIRLVADNIKSYKKLIYALTEFDSCLLVTCDDDWMYPSWFIKDLYLCHQKHPKCICAYRAQVMKWQHKTGKQRALVTYSQWGKPDKSHSTSPSSVDIFPTTGGGALYPVNSLHKEVVNPIFMRLCPTADDIWFKAMSLLNKTKVVMVKEKSIDFHLIEFRGSQKQTLWQINETKNDEQLKNVFDYFHIDI